MKPGRRGSVSSAWWPWFWWVCLASFLMQAQATPLSNPCGAESAMGSVNDTAPGPEWKLGFEDLLHSALSRSEPVGLDFVVPLVGQA